MLNKKIEKLLSLLCKLSYREGDFVLSSGKKSSYYIDGKITTLNAEGACLIAEIFLDKIKKLNIPIDAIGGPTLGADPIVGSVLSLAGENKILPGLTGFIIRKEAKGYGQKKLIEGPWKEGSRVIIIEDVITTGASAFKAIEKVKDALGEIVYVFSVVDREEGGKKFLEDRGYNLFSIFTINDLKNSYKSKK
ncbi:orotate phosphoribosyltransferase [Candidatus Desantisbacteria bacterium]|nr:orotate phosphoribosyltransferase [Candidatus Desantisbacteria bacterium]